MIQFCNTCLNKEKYIVYLILFLAFAVRMHYFDVSQPILGDEGAYHYGALNLIENNVFTYDYYGAKYRGEMLLDSSNSFMPGYVFFLTILYKIFGSNIEVARYSNLVISVFIVWLVYKILKQVIVSRWIIYLVLILVSVYPGFIYNNQRVYTENLFTFLLLGASYYFIAFTNTYKRKLLVLVSTLLSISFFIRPVAIILEAIILLLLIFDKKLTVKERLKNVVVIIMPMMVFVGGWGFRNYLAFGSFMLSQGGDGPVIWGLMPYFIDVHNLPGNTVSEIFSYVYNISPVLFFKWKIFGHLQYMWWDVWDEFLTHPSVFLKRLGIVHHVVLVFYLLTLPLLIRRYAIKYYSIFFIPVFMSLFYLLFHGLPRYIWPSLPFVFISCAMSLEMFAGKRSNFLNRGDVLKNKGTSNIFRKGLFYISIVFSVIVFYSVFFFSAENAKEMSDYELRSKVKMDISSVEGKPVISNMEFDQYSKQIEYKNWSINGNEFKADGGAGILELHNLALNRKYIVSKVEIMGWGGFIYDRCIIYWKRTGDDNYSEERVFSFPTFFWQGKRTVYIASDVESLLIVPVVFADGVFHFENIVVTKYYCGGNNE